ncbi:hypothetical protein [Clostridium rectalis]|uniref:hypothetical protein n=1 Tax=Clostridium rectalis TaxID=2040295 RepID=UPI0013DE1759|nr:hypothetical protein [Clostridium rectalis]
MGRRNSFRGKVKEPTDFSYLISKPEEKEDNEDKKNNEDKDMFIEKEKKED